MTAELRQKLVKGPLKRLCEWDCGAGKTESLGKRSKKGKGGDRNAAVNEKHPLGRIVLYCPDQQITRSRFMTLMERLGGCEDE